VLGDAHGLGQLSGRIEILLDGDGFDDFPKIRLPLIARSSRRLALSPQQIRIVELLLRNKQDKEIAAELGLSFPTVRTYLRRIFDRVGVEDRTGLVLHVFALAQDRIVSKSCQQ